MSTASSFEVPRFGDDGLFPDERGWWSIPITISLWSAIFTVVYFSTRNLEIEDSVTASGYIGMLLATFCVVIFAVIPALAMTIGRVADDSLRRASSMRASFTFGGLGLGLGMIPALFLFALNPAYGWLPFTQFIIPSALAGLFGRIVGEHVVGNTPLKTSAIVATVMIVVGCLSVGVAVFMGAI
jgi:uncharacterized membrane protein YhaH (DUF805 family)